MIERGGKWFGDRFDTVRNKLRRKKPDSTTSMENLQTPIIPTVHDPQRDVWISYYMALFEPNWKDAKKQEPYRPLLTHLAQGIVDAHSELVRIGKRSDEAEIYNRWVPKYLFTNSTEYIGGGVEYDVLVFDEQQRTVEQDTLQMHRSMLFTVKEILDDPYNTWTNVVDPIRNKTILDFNLVENAVIFGYDEKNAMVSLGNYITLRREVGTANVRQKAMDMGYSRTFLAVPHYLDTRNNSTLNLNAHLNGTYMSIGPDVNPIFKENNIGPFPLPENLYD